MNGDEIEILVAIGAAITIFYTQFIGINKLSQIIQMSGGLPLWTRRSNREIESLCG